MEDESTCWKLSTGEGFDEIYRELIQRWDISHKRLHESPIINLKSFLMQIDRAYRARSKEPLKKLQKSFRKINNEVTILSKQLKQDYRGQKKMRVTSKEDQEKQGALGCIKYEKLLLNFSNLIAYSSGRLYLCDLIRISKRDKKKMSEVILKINSADSLNMNQYEKFLT